MTTCQAALDATNVNNPIPSVNVDWGAALASSSYATILAQYQIQNTFGDCGFTKKFGIIKAGDPNGTLHEVALSGVQDTDVVFAKCDGRNNDVGGTDMPTTNGNTDTPDCAVTTDPVDRAIPLAISVCMMDGPTVIGCD